ncbi:hypothetical protein RFI_25678 [Reticulomyxa filosa]|uniref:Uncharacterized protein n=1 Tax=Reticulomyxa filosa TaxID=46433 RepID=X6ME38_RETFI|nr:hypothetical protein RFI_25678 [Reticulomyxa filosa]|eukprot:ETO11697.1 hypothetical protein RFI_25678 [Reticulomyxa filosa]
MIHPILFPNPIFSYVLSIDIVRCCVVYHGMVTILFSEHRLHTNVLCRFCNISILTKTAAFLYLFSPSSSFAAPSSSIFVDFAYSICCKNKNNKQQSNSNYLERKTQIVNDF